MADRLLREDGGLLQQEDLFPIYLESAPVVTGFRLRQENGDALLREDGGALLLELGGQGGETGDQIRAGSPRRRVATLLALPRPYWSTSTPAAEFDAALTGTAAVSADLTTQITAAASLSGAGTVAADLTTSITAAASLAGTATVGADLDTAITAAASLTGTATVDASLVTPILLAVEWTGTASLTADLTTAIACAADLRGTAAFAADLEAGAPVVGGKAARARADALLRFRRGLVDVDGGDTDGENPPEDGAPVAPESGYPDAPVSHETSAEIPDVPTFGVPAPVEVLAAAPAFETFTLALPDDWDDETDLEDLLTLMALGDVL